MAEETNNAAAEAEQKAEASFGEGFGVTPPVAETAKVVEEPQAEPVADAPAVAPPPVPEKPRYAKVLQSDFDNLKAAAGKVASLESQVARMSQTLGSAEQLEQRIVEKIKAQTQAPLGLSVEMSDEDFAELNEAVPEIAKLTRTALERVLKKAGVKGTSGAAGVPQLKDEDFDSRLTAALDRREAKREQDAFVKAYPEWETIVNRVDVSKGETPDETNEFRRWLAGKPAEYQKKVHDTRSWRELHSTVDEFMASKTAPAAPAKPDRGAQRRAIMEDAVQPRTDGSPPPMPRTPTADEAFDQGFRQARGRAHA